MTRLICGSTGKSITLVGEPLANSGEGKVWRTNDNGYLAKIYHSSTLERVQKLAVMTAHPPTEPNSHLNHISFAWPKSSLKNAEGDCVGFLMPEIKGAKELLDIYNPQRRKRLKLQVDWRFLHTTAQNIASIIAALHYYGYVLGDIKQQNILVNNQALPSIIDTDSFQVRHPQNGKVYRCLVGSEGYTPPELIGKDFSNIDQTEIHDRFRLAVIIYQLLFGGESPFGGKWIGAGETPEIDELICQGLWLYALNSPFQPVERTIPIEIVHPEIQRCFLRCFNDGHKNPHLRPTAREWLAALKVASNSLMPCERIDGHYYSQTYGKCYWCDRSTNLGVEIFPGVVKVDSAAVVESTSQPQFFNNKIIGQLIHTLNDHSKSVTSVTFSPDGQILASGSWDNSVKIWDVAKGNLLDTFKQKRHPESVNSVAFSLDGKTLAIGTGNKAIIRNINKIWNKLRGEILETLTYHSKPVNSVAFSPNGKNLATGSRDTIIKIWDMTKVISISTLKNHRGGVNCVAFSPDGKTLVSGSWDNTIKLWEVTTGKLLQTLPGHSQSVNSVFYSPDGKTIASGSSDNTIKLWEVTTGKLLQTLSGHSKSVNSVFYSPDGKTIASGSSDNTIKLWEVTTGKLLQTLSGHSNLVHSVAFSLDGKTLASGSEDNTIKIWRITY